VAEMVMVTPYGHKVRTKSKRRYALVVDKVTFAGKLLDEGACILRTDNPHTAAKQAKFYQDQTGRPCWIYNTVAKRREYL
jgi:hypothetical protein